MAENVFPVRLGQLMEEERKRRKQHAISELCTVTRSTFWRYERGEIQPKASQLVEIAEYFEVSIDWLLGLTDKRNVNR